MEEDYNLAERYRIVRKHLDRLGYRQALSLDALPLIEKLLADLIQTTDSLKHFKSVAQDNIEACSQLQLATEPYKCDNARLVQECNELHLKLLDTNESHQKQIKELKKQVRKLEIDNSDLQLVSSRNNKKIKDLEAESAGKSAKILELQGKCCKPVISNTNLATKKRACYPLRRPTLEADPLPRTGSSSTTLPSSRHVEPHVFDLLEMADHRMNCLNREVTKLKGDLSIQNEKIHTLKLQLATKEKEIMRLKKMLDGGRPLSALTKDCFCKKFDKTHYGDGGDLKVLERAKQDLEEKLKDSMAKQHEAMSRALKLAERNEELEKELRDIDHIALAVEADCNSAVQENNKRVCRLQEKIEDLMTQVHVLESELTVERREAQELRADLEGCKIEKRNIQRVLESTLDEKKQMTDRINQLTILEKDLNDTIERLTKSCASQRQEIANLESSNNILKDQMYSHVGGGGGGDDREKNKENGEKNKEKGEKNKEKGEKNDKNKGKKVLKKRTAAKTRSTSPAVTTQNVNGHKEDEVTKDVVDPVSNGMQTFENQKIENEKDSIINSLKKTIERLEIERDYYRNEYNKFRQEFNSLSNGDNADLWTQACELRRQLNEKEQAMAELQRENKALDREKFNLEARLQTSKTQQRRPCVPCSPYSPCRPAGSCNCSTASPPSRGDASSTKAVVERLERERDTARADVDRLVEERDALRERLKIAVDAHTSEQRRLRENLSEAETRLKQLETERQDLMLSQGTRRATINGLEDQLEDLKQELRRTKEELSTQRTQYFQLRALQEQTDQALGDVQGQLGQSETELSKMLDHKRNVEQQQMQLDNQVKELKQECNMLRSNLAQLDQEKDQLLMNLDEKTERIAALEREVRFKEQQANGLEQQVTDFHQKYQICVDQTAEQERQLRTMEVEINNLQRQMASTSMDRENAIRENSRIQDDLAAVTCECRNLQRELEASRAESHDLKRQLQTYVTEVRRAEELLNRKENERSEMLNHFRSLSLEATVLETNNQSLESEAAEARGALQTAQDRLLDLERQIADRDCLIRGYETQIAELTQNVASMETQLHQESEQRRRAEGDLNAVRDLCVKLDQQKESLEVQLVDKEAMRAQCESQLARLKAEQNIVQDQMSRDNAAVDRLEAMLNQARQESLNNQTTNQELQSEMARLKQKISDLQNKLHTETSELRRYQNQAAEYSKQISELRRQMTNERFDRARKEEESRRTSSPSSSEKQTCPPCTAFKGPTPAPRPDPKTVNQWKIPAPSHRISEELTESCHGRPGLKKDAQRTNRFNGNPSHNSASSNSLCNHLVSNSRVINDYKTQEAEDVPCINIILKPILDTKTEQKDKGMQIVEITAILDNIVKHSISDSKPSYLDTKSDQYQAASKETEEAKTKCVKIQTGSEKNIQDVNIQTRESPTDENLIGIPATNQVATEAIRKRVTAIQTIMDVQESNQNRSVQFEDTSAGIANANNCSGNLIKASDCLEGHLLSNPDSTGINHADDLSIIGIADTQQRGTMEQETSTNPLEFFNSTANLLVNSEEKLNRTSELKSCVKNNKRAIDGNLSERIKQKIENLETESCMLTQSLKQVTNTSQGTQHESTKISTNRSSCTDLCKDMALQVELSIVCSCKSCSVADDGTISANNNSTLPSVLSNNSPIPRISINTTEETEQELPSKNDLSKLSIGNTFANPSLRPYSSPTEISSCSERKFTANDVTCSPRHPTLELECFKNVSCERKYPEIGRLTAHGNATEKSAEIKKNVAILHNGTTTQGFQTEEMSTLSKLGSNGNSSVRVRSTNTSDEAKMFEPKDTSFVNNNYTPRFSQEKENVPNPSKRFKSACVGTSSVSFSQISEYPTTTNTNFEDRKDSILSKQNTRSILTASDLTRPEFIRMLTELKEHTCSLEMQLSAMNEAMKRKQATRSKALSSTSKNYEPTKQNIHTSRTQTEDNKTMNELSYCTSELSTTDYDKFASYQLKTGTSTDTLCCSPSRDISLMADNQLEETCSRNTVIGKVHNICSPLKLGTSQKTSSHTVRSTEPKDIIVALDRSNSSVTKSKSRNPVFKTKRSYLWTPLCESDYRMWKRKIHKPSTKSMIIPKILSQSVSPNTSMVKSKVDVSCSPTYCYIKPDPPPLAPPLQRMFTTGSISPILKLEKSIASGLYKVNSTASNPSIDRATVRPVFMSSTLKKPVKASRTTKCRIVSESGSKSDYNVTTAASTPSKYKDTTSLMSSCDLNTSEYSSAEKMCCQGTAMESISAVLELSQEHVIPTSPFTLKKPKVRPRLGIKQSLFKRRNKDRSKSIPSNTCFSPSASRESFYESLSNVSSKNQSIQKDSVRPSPFQLKKLGAIPRLKQLSINKQVPSHVSIETDNSQSRFDDAACCSTGNHSEVVSKINVSTHSSKVQSVPADKILTKLLERHPGKNHFAYSITTEQNTPFLLNTFGKIDSEEEVNSTDYAASRTGQEYSCKEGKNDANGKKRKWNSGSKKLTKLVEKTDFSHSNVNDTVDLHNIHQSKHYQENSNCKSKIKKKSQSVRGSRHFVKAESATDQKCNKTLEQLNKTDSEQKDSKCTIRVTVSLDETSSSETIKK